MRGEDLYYIWLDDASLTAKAKWEDMDTGDRQNWNKLAEKWEVTVGAYLEFERAGWTLLALPPEMGELIVGRPATKERALMISNMIREKYGVVEREL